MRASTFLALVAVLAAAALGVSSLGGSSKSGHEAAAAAAQGQDVQATALARNAQLAAATFAQSGSNGYDGLSPAALNQIDPNLLTASATQPYLLSASGTQDSYTVVVASPATHNTFTLSSASGNVSRTCTAPGVGGCAANGTWQ